MVWSCSGAPVTDEERADIIAAALSARGLARAETDFELVTVDKCVVDAEIDADPRLPERTEVTRLYAVLPHDVQTDHYRERYSVTCEVSKQFMRDSQVHTQESCSESHERFLRHDRLPKEFSLRGDVSAETATAFLDHLIDYEIEPMTRDFLSRVLPSGGSIAAARSNGKLVIRISFTLGGDTLVGVESEAIRDPELRFHDIREW